jgi:type VI secretion system protein ImpM
MSAAVVTGTGVPGWFGKLPGLGDFASRRLPDAFVHGWDRWLQAGLACAHEQDADWLAGYLVAPIRRFWLAPGVLGPAGWAGLLMPSVDRVGRHFPLTVARPLQPLAAALAARDWYRALDHAARQVLDLDYTVDDFEQALSGLAGLHGHAPGLSDQSLADDLGDLRTVWWCDDAESLSGFASYDGLPPPQALAAMLGSVA